MSELGAEGEVDPVRGITGLFSSRAGLTVCRELGSIGEGESECCV